MGFWKNIFKTKKIVRVEILWTKEGLSEDDKLDNLVVGHMEGGFDGMVTADVFNDYHSGETCFRVHYDDGSTKTITLKSDNPNYGYYMSFVE